MKFDLAKVKVLVIGDLMVDHYTLGLSERMSPEAPVPVIIPESQSYKPGGAANVAANLKSLGAIVTCCGVVGDDFYGKELISLLKKLDINTDGIIIKDNHPTTVKHRFYANESQVVRVDTEKFLKVSYDKFYKIIDKDNYDVIIISDYNKGVINSKNMIKSIKKYIANRKRQSCEIIVDPKKDNFIFYKGADIVTPNLSELNKATKVNINDDQSILLACRDLIKNYSFNYVVAKKGHRGMTIVGKDDFHINIDAVKVKNPDVTGAGDTVIAVLSLIFSICKDIKLSAKISNHAASTVVSKTGTVMIEKNEIEKIINLVLQSS